jgi:hypothetical protein
VGRSLELPLAALWAGAAVAVVSAWRHREREVVLLAAGAAAWIAIVAVLAAAGYAGLPRFAAPAAAVVCVLGGIGLTRSVAAIDGMRLTDRRRRPALVLTAGAIAVLAIQGAIRAAEIPGELERASDYREWVGDLDSTVDDAAAGGRGECAPVTTTDYLAVTPLAWERDVAMAAISVRTRTLPGDGIAFVSAEDPPPVAARIARLGALVAREGDWAAYELSCPAASGASGSAIAAVAGASRYGGSSTSSSSR